MKSVEELEAQNGVYSVGDIALMFNRYGLSWIDDNTKIDYSAFTLVKQIYPDLEVGFEVTGLYSGYEFNSDDNKIHVRTEEGIRGMTRAILFVCTDGQVIFY